MRPSVQPLLVFFACSLIAFGTCIHPPEFPKPNKGQCSSTLSENEWRAIVNNFVINIVETFGDQALEDRHEFAVIILVPPTTTDVLTIDYLPRDRNTGGPIVNSQHALSPPEPRSRVNYVVARPASHNNSQDIHAEVQVLGELDSLIYSFRCEYDTDPAAIVLYTWIFPCEYCFSEIANFVQNRPMYNHIPQMLLYSTQGIPFGLTPDQVLEIQRSNNWNLNFLRNLGILTLGVRCYRHPHSRRRRSLGGDVCIVQKTVQSCLFDKLQYLPESHCGSPSNQRDAVVAEVVNRLMKSCADESFQEGCGKEYLLRPGILSGACGEIRQTNSQFLEDVNRFVDSCLADGDLIISKPLSVSDPTTFPGVLRKTYQLAHTETTIPCEDNRREGLFCSHWKPEYISAGYGICKADHPCGFHDYSYRWCYLQKGSWAYCCDEGAPCINEYCLSGSKDGIWCYEKGPSWISKDGNPCLPYVPCGYHDNNRFHPWCIVDTDQTWEYCSAYLKD